jgi:hypothetical protein
MEKFPSQQTEIVSQSVEQEANFEGNDTLVLISRLRHPTIKRQVATLAYQEKFDRASEFLNEEWEPYLPEGWTGKERFKLLKGKHGGKIISTEDYETKLQNTRLPGSIEEVEAELDKNIDEVASVTEIDYTSDSPNADVIPLNWSIPWGEGNSKPTVKQMSIIEAHEKGHRIRDYDGFTEDFRKGFDMSKVQFTDTDYDVLKKDAENRTTRFEVDESESTLEVKREQYLNGYLFTGREIAERMSQLKNYFGFRGDEVFTAEHLRYAKEHYIQDTQMDNAMRLFFEGITPETEEIFLQIINNAGI